MLNSAQAKQLRQLPVVRDEKDKDPPKTRAKTDRWMKSDGWTPIAHVESYQPPPFWPYFSPQRAGPAFVIADDEGYAVWTSCGTLIAPLSVSLSFLRYACCFFLPLPAQASPRQLTRAGNGDKAAILCSMERGDG
jgi:hypothetical protein